MKCSKFKNHKNSIGLLFWQTATLWQRAIKETLRPYNLTHTQYVILAVIQELNESDENVTQKKISDFSMIDIMTTSSTLRLLEKKKLICRTISTVDSRANSIKISSSGSKLLCEATPDVENVDEAFFFKNNIEDITSLKQLLLKLKQKNDK